VKSNSHEIRKKIIYRMSIGNKNNILKSDMYIRPIHLKNTKGKQVENINSTNLHSIVSTFNFVNISFKLKEDMIGDDMFELDAATGKVITPPLGNSSSLQLSSMTSLWLLVYRLRPSARCVIHTHSMNSVLASLLNEGEEMLPKNDGKNNSNIRELVVTHQEMIKGVGGHAYDSTLKIPIIDNKSSEGALAPDMERAILQYPKCNAVLVARHGVYVWGDSWEEAKTRLESFDFLFEFCVKLKSTLNINPGDHPFQKEKDVKGMKRKRDEGKV